MSSSNTRYDLWMLMSTYKFAFIHALTNHVGLSAMVCFGENDSVVQSKDADR